MAAVLLCAGSVSAASLPDAIAAIQRGDFVAAEKELRAEVAAHPGEAAALSLLGVALDNQKKVQEAAAYHRRALAAAPQSMDVLGNYGNHLIAAGDAEGARQAYQKITDLDPANSGANLQLIRLALQRKDAAEALARMRRLPEPALNDSRLAFSLGVAFANAREFTEAEGLFTRALQSTPADFHLLYNLGAVALAAGDYVRARGALEAALHQQPENVDLLYQLARVNRALGRNEAALELLAEAAKSAPQRPDVQKLLAASAADLGALEDALAAWDRYLKLSADDDAARRERAFTVARLGRTSEGVAELKQYLSRHPDDAIAHYQSGVIESQDDPAAGLAALNQAISLRPGFAAARSLRGSIYYQQGKPEAALADLEIAVKGEPNDPETLDRLGQTYLALDRTADAVRTLRRAADLAPSDSTVQLHLGRALAQAGNAAESKAAMDRFRRLGPVAKHGVPAGLVDYLALTPEQRRADYRTRVEKAVREHPDDAAAELDYLNLLLDDGKLAEASATANRIAALDPAPSPELAIANARLLEATGKPEEALKALAAAPATPEICWREIALLVRLKRPEAALRILNQAGNDDELQLLKAAVLAIAGRREEAEAMLDALGRRRPEWAPVWVARACLGSSDSGGAMQTAASLGSTTRAPVDLRKLLQEKRPADW